MRSFIILALLVATLLLPAASAEEESTTMIYDLEYFVQIYNESIASAPDIVKNILGSEKVQIQITMGNGSVYVAGFETKDATIVSTVEGGFEDWTILIETGEDVISRINEADDPVAAFKGALESNEISVTGKSLAMKLKLKLALSSISLLNFFGDLFFG